MPIDDDTKVFDVARPAQTYPDATSRPVIVGHRPHMSDPMVRESATPHVGSDSTPIHVAVADGDGQDNAAHSTLDNNPSIAEQNPAAFSSLVDEHPPEQEEHQPAQEEHQPTEPASEPANEPAPDAPTVAEDSKEQPGSESDPPYTPLSSLISPESGVAEHDHNQQAPPPSTSHDGSWPETPPLHIPHGAGPRRRWPKILLWLLVALVLVIVAGYLAIDAGLVKSNIKLPFHIFNQQKTSNNSTTSTTTSSTTSKSQSSAPALTPSVPTGFTAYSVSGAGISFDYLTAWGAPTVKADPGFSKRGGTNKSDGTYAYVVDFATNKDIELALTSSKSLPTTRGALYYDFLQWCVGTNDGKFYKQSMHSSTAAGVDTPANVVCDQGPLTDATKIDNQTIAQLKTKDASGAVLGDLYTQNLTNTNWTVLRVKDAAMTNGDKIKTLLTTVKTSSASSSSTTTP